MCVRERERGERERERERERKRERGIEGERERERGRPNNSSKHSLSPLSAMRTAQTTRRTETRYISLVERQMGLFNVQYIDEHVHVY